MGAPGTIPISIRRRAIALDPSTLTTRAAKPAGSVSSDPDSLASGFDCLSFLLNLFPPLADEIENGFQFRLKRNSNRRATPSGKRASF
jgi:hypothetical protein